MKTNSQLSPELADIHDGVVPTGARSFRSLMSLPVTEERKIVVPLLPEEGIALLSGKPDCGKSMFARHFSLAVALKHEEFLGYKLCPRSGRVIYISTEDTESTTSAIFRKQLGGLVPASVDDCSSSDERSPEAVGSRPTAHLELASQEFVRTTEVDLDLLFDDGNGPEALFVRLATELQKGPCDLVIIDSFGDAFTGKDSNSNSELRKALAPYHGLAMEHHVLILFLTHLTKSGYNQTPDQRHVAGGAALAQKARVILQLERELSGDTRLLCVTKGNGVPDEYKRQATRLFFDAVTCLYEATGETVEIASVGKTTGRAIFINWVSTFNGVLELPKGEIERRIAASHGIKERRARHYIKEQLFNTRYGHYTYDGDFAASAQLAAI